MPPATSCSARRCESCQFELPPSTITSPCPRMPPSSRTVDSVMSPAGTISQTTLGDASFAHMSASDVAPSAPAVTAASTASADGSYATT